MNRVQFARQKLLLGNFLCSEDLTQAEYEVVTDPLTKDSVILAMFDNKTGGNLSKKVQNALDETFFPCLNADLDEGDGSGEDESPESEGVTEPSPQLGLTPCPA